MQVLEELVYREDPFSGCYHSAFAFLGHGHGFPEDNDVLQVALNPQWLNIHVWYFWIEIQ